MTDAHEALAQVRKALAARPTPGEWHVWQYRRFSNPNVRNADGIYVMDAVPRRSVRKGVDASYIAACNPVNMTAILAHVDAQEAEIERLRKLLCKCDMRTRLVGDGCEFCNPTLADELEKEQR